jgi:hypothetical protein
VINLIKSEVLKVRSTQVWMWMILPAVALTGLATAGTVYGSITDNEQIGVPIRYYDIFTQSGGAAVALLVIGILGLTTEFRHKTITPTLLATPSRTRVVIGKALSYSLFAVFYALVCGVVNFAIAIIWLNAKNVPLDFGHGVVMGVVKALLALVLTALFGLGLGAMVRNQAAAMVIGILYFAIISNLLGIIPWVRKAYPYTPGGAIRAFTSNGSTRDTASDVHMLVPVVGGLVFLAWAVLLLVSGGYLSLKRDIS